MSALPFVDRLTTEVPAPPEAVWRSLCRTIGGGFGDGTPGADLFARAVGVRDRGGTGRLPEVGATIRGFRVARADEPSRLLLEGRHRFSTYELEFTVDETPGGSVLAATTRAAFPGLKGRAYRAMVIGSRAHVVLLTRLLGQVARRAVGPPAAAPRPRP